MKLGLIGIGKVGSQILNDIQYLNLFSDIVIIDENTELVRGEILDYRHAQGLKNTSNINIKSGSYSDLKDVDVIVITASAPMSIDMPDRTALTKDNISIVKDIMENIIKFQKEALIIFVTNPVDAMNYIAVQTSDYPKEKIIGTGTLLESARFKTLIADHYDIDPKSVEAFVIGEHGKHAVPIWSKVRISGMNIEEFEKLSGKVKIDTESISNQIDKVSFDVLKGKGWTNVAISKTTVELIKSLVLDERSILPVSSINTKNTHSISLPTLLSRRGVEKVFNIDISDIERKQFENAEKFIENTIAIQNSI
ncbi:lactate/malate family dehydrogenase [Staphylococcus aureus]|uniref:lactate/malate family dehydrogenase n=1 Tax=Staphylococcus aureus TaxID=1280 RepID=UPI00193A1208|nr:lactate dehydrogenase [Staphylococcus aureus]